VDLPKDGRERSDLGVLLDRQRRGERAVLLGGYVLERAGEERGSPIADLATVALYISVPPPAENPAEYFVR
jgi:hypothetical protein